MSKNKRIDSIPQVSNASVHIEKIPWINTERLDPRISLKRWWWSWGGIGKFALDIWQTSGVKPTRNFAPIRGGNVGDIYVNYPEINILWHGNMRAHITKVSNVWDIPISLKKGDIVSVRGRIYSNNWAFGLTFSGWTYRLLFWTSMAINRSNPQTDFIVTSDGTLDLKYADDGTSNFISAITITIN